jgi:hypothetical protein
MKMRLPRKIQPGDTWVAECKGWLLVYQARQTENPDWANFKLYRRVPSPKTVYWLAYNRAQHRMAQGNEESALLKYHPDIATWAFGELTEWVRMFHEEEEFA